MTTSPSAGDSVHGPRQRSLVAEPCKRAPLGPVVVASRARPRSLATEPLRPTARRRSFFHADYRATGWSRTL